MTHISSSFHPQFKGGLAAPVDQGGYVANLNYMEVHGAYLLHQDFTVVIFNSLLLHGTGNSGPLKRVSCDIRFFPFCGFLPTETHMLVDQPQAFLEDALVSETRETLRAPLLEDAAWLGRTETEQAAPNSILNWPNYLMDLFSGNDRDALARLRRFVNTDLGVDPPEVFISKFHGYPMNEEKLRDIRKRVPLESFVATAGAR